MFIFPNEYFHERVTLVKVATMGIKGLKSFLKENAGRVFSSRILVRGNLIVDGYSVLHELYANRQLDWLNGGRYSKQHTATFEFFEPLVRAGVVPIVVLDGGGLETNVRDTIKRRKEGIGDFQADMRKQRENRDGDNHGRYHLPLLSRHVFTNSLKQLEGVQVYIADGKAFHTIVGLAEHFGCPVLTNSTDYCVSDVTGGVIFYEDLDPTNCTAPIFSQFELAKLLDFKNPDLLLAVASIIGDSGNKFLPKQYHGTVRQYIEDICTSHNIEQPKKRSWILNIAFFINHYNCTSFKDFEDKISQFNFGHKACASLSKNCFSAKRYFTIQSKLTMESFKTTSLLRCSGQSEIPKDVIERYREGSFPTIAMNAICVGKCTLDSDIGDPNQQPISVLGCYTRRFIYGLTMPLLSTSSAQEIDEYYRCTKMKASGNPWDYVPYKEDPLIMVKYSESLSVDCILKLNKQDRESLAIEAITDILMCPKETHSKFDKVLDNTYLLGIMTTRRWLRWLRRLHKDDGGCTKLDHLPYQLARAVVLSFLWEREDDKEQEDLYFNPMWIKVYHAILEWQSLYHDVCDLNTLLLSPFPELPTENIIDGAFVIELTLDSNPDSIITEHRKKLTVLKQELYDRIVAFLECQ